MIIVLLVLMVAPAPLAERYTSPTQDGQFLIHPLRSYGFIFALAGATGSAAVGNPGKALAQAKTFFTETGDRPMKVALLYLSDREEYAYITKNGERLVIAAPPALVWEVWGTHADMSASEGRADIDIVGFLDYSTGERIGINKGPVAEPPGLE